MKNNKLNSCIVFTNLIYLIIVVALNESYQHCMKTNIISDEYLKWL